MRTSNEYSWKMAGVKQGMTEQHLGLAAGKTRGERDPLGVNSEIGRKLREYYDGLMSPEVPDRFTDLLSKLEKTESETSKSGGGE